MASSSNNNVNNEAVANNSSSLSQEVARDNRRVVYVNGPQAGGGPITRQRAKSTRTHRSPYLRPNTSTSCVSAVRGSNVQPVCGSEIICNRKARTELVKFVWNIDNFSFYKDSRGQDLDIIESPPFQNNEGTYNWRLRFIIHPRPQRESDVACKDYVQVFVQLDSGPTPTVPVMVQLILTRHRQNVPDLSYSISRSRDFKVRETWGFRRFIVRDHLFNPQYGFVNNDRVQFICKINMILSSEDTIKTGSPIVPRNIRSSCLDKLGDLLETGRFSDCVLVSDDNKEIKAHKAIIAANSEVIARAFESSCEEGSTSRYKMVGFSYNICEQIVEWMYKKSCDMLDEYADELFEAADQYDIEDLQNAASNSILDSLSMDNALRRYKVADMHDDDELKSRIGGFIKMNIREIRHSDTWRALKEADPRLINELLESFVDG